MDNKKNYKQSDNYDDDLDDYYNNLDDDHDGDLDDENEDYTVEPYADEEDEQQHVRDKRNKDKNLTYVDIINIYKNNIYLNLFIGFEGKLPQDKEEYLDKLKAFNELASTEKDKIFRKYIREYRETTDQRLKEEIEDNIFYFLLLDIEPIIRKQVHFLGEDSADIVNELYLAFRNNILNKFDLDSENTFKTYASNAMRNRIYEYSDVKAAAGKYYSKTNRIIKSAERKLLEQKQLKQIDAETIHEYTGIDKEIIEAYLNNKEIKEYQKDYELLSSWKNFLEFASADEVPYEVLAEYTGMSVNRVEDVLSTANKNQLEFDKSVDGDDENIILHDIIPDTNMPTPEQELHNNEKREIIHNAFSIFGEENEDNIYKYLSNYLLVDYNRHMYSYKDIAYRRKDKLEEKDVYKELVESNLFKKSADGRILIYEEDLFDGVDIPKEEWDEFSDKIMKILTDEGKSQYVIHESEMGYSFYLLEKGKKRIFITDKEEILNCYDINSNFDDCIKAIDEFKDLVKQAEIVKDNKAVYPSFRFKAIDRNTLKEPDDKTKELDKAMLCELYKDENKVVAGFYAERRKDRSYLNSKLQSDDDLINILIKHCNMIKEASIDADIYTEKQIEYIDEFKDLYNQMAEDGGGTHLLRGRIKDDRFANRRKNIEVLKGK